MFDWMSVNLCFASLYDEQYAVTGLRLIFKVQLDVVDFFEGLSMHLNSIW